MVSAEKFLPQRGQLNYLYLELSSCVTMVALALPHLTAVGRKAEKLGAANTWTEPWHDQRKLQNIADVANVARGQSRIDHCDYAFGLRVDENSPLEHKPCIRETMELQLGLHRRCSSDLETTCIGIVVIYTYEILTQQMHKG